MPEKGLGDITLHLVSNSHSMLRMHTSKPCMCAKQLTGIRRVYSIDCFQLLASLAQEHSPASTGHPWGRDKVGGQSDMGVPAGEQNEYVSGCPGRQDSTRENVASSFLSESLHHKSSQERHTAREGRWNGSPVWWVQGPLQKVVFFFFLSYISLKQWSTVVWTKHLFVYSMISDILL